MINITLLFWILIAHWVADFIYQSNEDAQNKWHSLFHLSRHAATYAVILLGFCFFGILFTGVGLVTIYLILYWVGINWLLHWITDYFTSKWTHALWEKKDTHNFFIVIGCDQLIHYICLISTWAYLIRV